MSRPSLYTDELAEEICDQLASGLSMVKVCELDGMPDRSTVLRWLQSADNGFAAKYARARDLQADVMDDKILDVADACTPETAAADRVKIGAYQWRASKLAPKKYGDKVALVGGSGDDEPIQVTSDRERAKAMAALIAKSREG